MSMPEIGMKEGAFVPCPDSPNCVSSMASDTAHYIEPIATAGLEREEAFARMQEILAASRGCTVITAGDFYIHAEFRSKLFRFVDDVECYFPEEESIIHIRSASRVGYSDLGVNRKRVEQLRSTFSAGVE